MQRRARSGSTSGLAPANFLALKSGFGTGWGTQTSASGRRRVVFAAARWPSRSNQFSPAQVQVLRKGLLKGSVRPQAEAIAVGDARNVFRR